ncbi:GNAT family N-acetyltransferase [Streptomyces tauricus]|uniref:GNAT family N-acetyltransferase n=1 Tax=Streptomyces tauricus TaxID=68274 RepID=A0ABZ1JP44_9ACTN|nr:GNAT family N-acetyltransferase [Streptomyces tauricus]
MHQQRATPNDRTTRQFVLPEGALALGAGLGTLRVPRAADVPALVAGTNDPEVRRWLPVPRPYTEAMALRWCTEEAERRRREGEGLHLAVTDEDDGLIGTVCLKHTNWRTAQTEVGYWLVPGARGRGLATRACRVLSQWALSATPIERVVLVAATGNTASQRVATQSGFTYEGTARSGGILFTGRTDLRVYSLLRADVPESAPGETTDNQ